VVAGWSANLASNLAHLAHPPLSLSLSPSSFIDRLTSVSYSVRVSVIGIVK